MSLVLLARPSSSRIDKGVGTIAAMKTPHRRTHHETNDTDTNEKRSGDDDDNNDDDDDDDDNDNNDAEEGIRRSEDSLPPAPATATTETATAPLPNRKRNSNRQKRPRIAIPYHSAGARGGGASPSPSPQKRRTHRGGRDTGRLVRKRRRCCLPKSIATPSAKPPKSGVVAVVVAHEEIRLKKNFAGKLFRLVESCTRQQLDSSNRPSTSSSPSPSHSSKDAAMNDCNHGAILSWLVSPPSTNQIQTQTQNQTKPSFNHHRPRRHHHYVSDLNAAPSATTTATETETATLVPNQRPIEAKENPKDESEEGLWSLVVWDKDRFLESELVRTSFPSQSTFRSFERQLNSWGFKRDHGLEEQVLARQSSRHSSSNQNSNQNKNSTASTKSATIPTTTILTKESLRAFHHPCFQKGRPDLLEGVKRRPPGSGNKEIKDTIVHTAATKSSSTTKEASSSSSALSTPCRKRRPLPEVSSGGLHESPPRSLVSVSTSASAKQLSSNQMAPQEQNSPLSLSSIRTDIVLPSGACLRINQRIPAWAIPAQEAAIRYLYQKHSQQANVDANLDACGTPRSNATAPTAQAVRNRKSPPPEEWTGRSESGDGYSSSCHGNDNAYSNSNSNFDNGESDSDDSSSSANDSERASSKDSFGETTSPVVVHHPQESPAVFCRQRRTGGWQGRAKNDLLGSLLQQSQPPPSQTSGHARRHSPRHPKHEEHNHDNNYDDDYDRFCDASEDEETPTIVQSSSTAVEEENHGKPNDPDQKNNKEEENWLVI